MKRIATLTVNPAKDVAYEADRVFHTHKIRAHQEHYDPDGGINMARAIARLGGPARAHYLVGGATGATLDSLLDMHQMVRSSIPIQGNTPVSTAVYERETAKEFRFGPRGPASPSGIASMSRPSRRHGMRLSRRERIAAAGAPEIVNKDPAKYMAVTMGLRPFT
ncbi:MULTISPECIES: hypothetical protein [Sphingomonadaceae]|uniref:Carbohydrate kinase PfkB domain-containing protein n=1 Tax=Sphingomonas sanxanigenens DSM 19645 = NX02 TaxID=1123269 RepID=W0ABD0_9SPHN|nr:MULTISPECIES: hypothetical protein [Sphingomonadaceae]AHE53613.1 hypothetical protein NX02_09460 [Sphingomonas sanxanigenens DSM 19645 = NX02]OAN53401.1 hypothetical protein A7Q26_05075 [Sphingobium sp. TCM1]